MTRPSPSRAALSRSILSRFIKACAVLVIAAGIFYGGYRYLQHNDTATAATKPAASRAALVVTQIVTPQTLVSNIGAVGTVLAGESAAIHAEIAGRIDAIHFAEGQPVQKDDILVQIDKSLIQNELATARAAFNASKATFDRDDGLKKSGFVSNQKWDLSKAAFDSAQAALRSAEIRLQKSTLRAPFDGIAGLRDFSVGDYAQTGQRLTTVVSIDPVRIEFSLPERDFSHIRDGQKISFSVDAFPDEDFTAEIYATDPQIDPQTRNFTVRARAANPQQRLQAGMFARINVATARRENVLMIPEESVVPQGNENYVYVIVDGVARLQRVDTGLRRQGQVEITGGIVAGDEIVTAGLLRIRDGAAVVTQSGTTAPTTP